MIMSKANPESTKAAPEPEVSADLRKALAAAPQTAEMWGKLTSIGRRDFIAWIESAKQPETRQRRIESLGSRLASGKRRPCCYAVVPMNFYKALGASPEAKAYWKSLTPDARRDFIDWIDSAQTPDENKRRIEKACTMLVAGKKRPGSARLDSK